MFAPVRELGLVVVWDDGDDLHAEPRAPYPHVREVLLLRAHLEEAAAVVGGFARTAEAEQLIASGWARPVERSRADVRRTAPRTRATGDDHDRARDEAVAGLAATMVGASQRVLEIVLEHIKDRKQFGVPIGSFQAVKHMAVDMYVAIERARALCHFAGLAIAEDDPRRGRVVDGYEHWDYRYRIVTAGGLTVYRRSGFCTHARAVESLQRNWPKVLVALGSDVV